MARPLGSTLTQRGKRVAVRLEVALPVSIAFIFGCAVGLVIGHVLGKGGQVRPQQAAATEAAPQEAPDDEAHSEARLLQMLDVHEKLLTEKPDDVGLLTTVGNYRAAVGRLDEAEQAFAKAETLARQGQGSPRELAQVLSGQAMVLAERGDPMAAVAKCDEAASLDVADVQSRALQVYIYMTRIMPSAPPGLDRKETVRKVKSRIEEILALDPQNADALQFKELIEGVERSRGGMGDTAPPSRP
jgi:hypothetical protein